MNQPLNNPDPKQVMASRQFGKELSNVKKMASKANAPRRGRRERHRGKNPLFYSPGGAWSRANMKHVEEIKQYEFSHKDMVEVLWAMYKNNWG